MENAYINFKNNYEIPGDTQDIGKSDGAEDEPGKGKPAQHAP